MLTRLIFTYAILSNHLVFVTAAILGDGKHSTEGTTEGCLGHDSSVIGGEHGAEATGQ